VRIKAKNQFSLTTRGDQAGRAADFIDSIDPKRTFGCGRAAWAEPVLREISAQDDLTTMTS
jgi:hypothetical protein